MAAPFSIHNTLTRRVEPFEPLKAGHVGLYVCGMTVYAPLHVGHARAMVTFDVFVRYLRYRGWNVTFVRNFTDVDDKIIQRATEAGVDPADWAQRYIDAFHQDVKALGLADPDLEPRVSTSIDAIHGMISALIERGHAYASEGTVWFDVKSAPDYGQLSGQKVDELRSADADTGKRHPADFALWKAAKPGEPAWPSPWGPGRPGWHIECSAMAESSLGDTIDIHGGGLDLVFPHHENEVAQSECAHGAKYVRYWMHNGLLNLGDKKMGKSTGNVVNVEDLLREWPAEAVRLYYLQNHYRSPLPWNDTAMAEALAMLARIYEARELAHEMGGDEPTDRVIEALGADARTVHELGTGFVDAMHAALDNDFNTSAALSNALELARAINRLANHKKAKKRAGPVVAPALAAFQAFHTALGLLEHDFAGFQEEVKSKRLAAMGLTRDGIEQRIQDRHAAREAKDWALADTIRAELEGQSILVMDRPGGSDWRIRLG
ncbi:MAG: cysteine--tRNA ligase [Alphaproteobacteria bacterium]|nr:cysteine--tRNA ligase [Alphaproteobacteria bacterium]MCB9694885.1 cysteine--tRNA ligase [Alphaproteobacteria bacterium]